MSDKPYTLNLTEGAEKDLKRLDQVIAVRIVKKLRWLASNAEVYPHEALAGRWRGLYRLRVGDYRAIYALEHGKRRVMVEIIGHRREVYDE